MSSYNIKFDIFFSGMTKFSNSTYNTLIIKISVSRAAMSTICAIFYTFQESTKLKSEVNESPKIIPSDTRSLYKITKNRKSLQSEKFHLQIHFRRSFESSPARVLLLDPRSSPIARTPPFHQRVVQACASDEARVAGKGTLRKKKEKRKKNGEGIDNSLRK